MVQKLVGDVSPQIMEKDSGFIRTRDTRACTGLMTRNINGSGSKMQFFLAAVFDAEESIKIKRLVVLQNGFINND